MRAAHAVYGGYLGAAGGGGLGWSDAWAAARAALASAATDEKEAA